MKKNITTVLPKKMVEQIESLEFTKTMKAKAYYFIRVLLSNCEKHHGDFRVFYEMGTNYLSKIFTKNYHNQFLNQLLTSGIIETDGRYKIGDNYNQGKCKGYRVNEELLRDELVEISHKDIEKDSYIGSENLQFTPNFSYTTTNQCNPITIFSPIFLHICTQLLNNSSIYDDLRSLYFDENSLMSVLNEKLKGITKESLLINDDVEDTRFEWYNHPKQEKYYITKENAIKEAEEICLHLIQDSGKYYLDDLFSYIERKKFRLRYNYMNSISAVVGKNYYAKRNPQNNRLDHNLTSISKDLLKVIKKDNDLVEIDIINSQFAIHAHWLQQTELIKYEDVIKYCELCSKGMLYEGIGQLLNMSRKETKELMFSTVFSKSGNSFPEKELIKEVFPNVINHIDEFKQSNYSYKNFAITLQRVEATMMIDNIYYMIKTNGYFCLPKHDSLIIKKEEVYKVMKVIEAYFKVINFDCELTIT